MIKFTDDKEQIISLWRSVFKEDSREDVLFFLEESKNIKCFGCFEKEKLVSMLFLADCCYADLTGKYVYAVCTDEGFRNKGYSSSLIDEAKKYMKDFLWLIPAHDSLLIHVVDVSNKNFENQIVFDEKKEIIEYLYAGSDYTYPVGMVYSVKNFPVGNTGITMKK